MAIRDTLVTRNGLIGIVMYGLIQFGSVSFCAESAVLTAPATRKAMTDEFLPSLNQNRVSGQFHKGETLSKILNSYNLTTDDIQQMTELTKKHIQLNRINAGTAYALSLNEDETTVESFTLQLDIDRELVLNREGQVWTSVVKQAERTITRHVRCGVIKGTLWNAAKAADITPGMILDLADLFSCQIDFACDLRNDDMFKILFEMTTYKNGKQVPSNILAAKFVNKDKVYYAFRFERPDGSADYYDEHGKTLKSSFLKSPLNYRYISSGFSKNRYHPILKKHRAHLGIDYAAPAGTPVSALGDGVVIFKGWKGGYGNFIHIKHDDVYETCYGHLANFAQGLKQGMKVRQGQVIGYVGSTGLSTGPHLDFRVKCRNEFINPLSLESRPCIPLPENQRSAFDATKKQLMTLIGETSTINS